MGDPFAAVLGGRARPWRELSGQVQPRQWSVPELFARGLLAGAASWGSPAPGPGAELDLDGQRGIAGTPDEAALWDAWGEVGAALERANREAGVSMMCVACRSIPRP